MEAIKCVPGEAIEVTPGLRCGCGRLILTADDIGKIENHIEPVHYMGFAKPVGEILRRREVLCVTCSPRPMSHS